MLSETWKKIKNIVVHRILGVHDTPHRIAWGTFWGLIIAWTPTIGFQIMLYLLIAPIVRANKVSGIPLLFISNPFTAIPLYYGAWKVGSLALHGNATEGSTSAQTEKNIIEMFSKFESIDFLNLEFWKTVGNTFVALGGELWLGSFILGFLTAAPTYFLTYWAVRQYRRRFS